MLQVSVGCGRRDTSYCSRFEDILPAAENKILFSLSILFFPTLLTLLGVGN
jgi:hypothetical protein